jgi:hypothetical protein
VNCTPKVGHPSNLWFFFAKISSEVKRA